MSLSAQLSLLFLAIDSIWAAVGKGFAGTVVQGGRQTEKSLFYGK